MSRSGAVLGQCHKGSPRSGPLGVRHIAELNRRDPWPVMRWGDAGLRVGTEEDARRGAVMKTWGEKYTHDLERKIGEIWKVYLTDMTTLELRNNCRTLCCPLPAGYSKREPIKGLAKMPNGGRTSTSTEKDCHAWVSSGRINEWGWISMNEMMSFDEFNSLNELRISPSRRMRLVQGYEAEPTAAVTEPRGEESSMRLMWMWKRVHQRLWQSGCGKVQQ